MIKEEIAAVQKVMDENGFRWVDGDVLKNTPYDGVIKGETIPGQPAFSSWWDRFFEYN